MYFDDLNVEVTEERIAEMRREADEYRLGNGIRRLRRARARRRWTLRRDAATAKVRSVARIANEILGAIISPTWPESSHPHRPIHPNPGR
jgi:hypothetical protein